MNRFLCILLCLIGSLPSLAHASKKDFISALEKKVSPPPPGDCEQPPDDSPPVFRFDKKAYFLRGENDGIREYLTANESFSHWTTLMANRHISTHSDPQKYAALLVETATSSQPNARGQVIESKDGLVFIADFLLFSTDRSAPPFAEWNLWRIERKNGFLQAVQYARRFYTMDLSVAEKIQESRKHIVPLLFKFQIPE